MVFRSAVGDVQRAAWARRFLILLGAVFAFTCGFNASFNHWYVSGPLLLDAGWHSGVMFHRGWNPQTLLIEYPVPRAFFSFHLSPFMSFFGVLSNVFPGDRAMYFCVVQGLVYAPFGAAAASMLPDRVRAGEAALAMLSGVCVMFSGQVLACLGYPHLEPFVPAAITMMLAAMVRGQVRAAVVWLVLCTTLREDAGFHAASFGFAALACNLTKRPFPLSTKTLVKLTALAFVLSLVVFVAQKKLWPGPGLFREEYLGEPAYAHLSWAELGRRTSDFGERCGFIYAPLLATVAIAIVRRDPRYLFGFVVELPWLLVNFLAAQPLKARFELYTGFPFIASAFWVLAYAHVEVAHAKPARFATLRTFLPFVLVSLAGTFASYRQGPWTGLVMDAAVARGATDRRAIEALANRLRANPNPTGHTRVDIAVASWTTESMAPAQVVAGSPPDGLAGASEFYFWKRGFDSGRYPVWLAHEPSLDTCGALHGTEVRWCGRGPLPPGFEPMSPMLEHAVAAPGVARAPSGALTLPKGDGVAAWFGLYDITPGDYRATWSYDATGCDDSAGGVFDVVHSGTIIAQRRASPRGSAVTLTFRIEPHARGDELVGWELRASQWTCPVTIENVRFVVDTPGDTARIAAENARASDHALLAPFAPWIARAAADGSARVDPAVAAWAHAAAPTAEIDATRGLGGASEVYFFREGTYAQKMPGWLANEPGMGTCSAIPMTELRFCGVGAQPEGAIPSSPLLDRAVLGLAKRTSMGEIELAPSSADAAHPELGVWGPFATLAPGDYVATWSYDASSCAASATAAFDVAHAFGRVAEGRATAQAREASVPFHVDAATTELWEFRAYRWPCAATLHGLRVVKAPGGPIAPAHPL